MANIAKKIIRENGFDDVITVVPKSSMVLSAPQGFAINILFIFLLYFVDKICYYYYSICKTRLKKKRS